MLKIILMKKRYLPFLLLLLLSVTGNGQQITFSEPYRDDSQDMNFEILGKIKGRLLIFKNVRWHYAVNIYNDSMVMTDNVDMDFLPGKTFNVDCIVYPDYFYLIYQYQRKGILYCMGAKMDANGRKIGDPIELDTTQVGVMGDNRIYTTIFSEDRKQIMVFKIQRRDDRAHFLTKLYDQNLQLQHQSRTSIPFDDRQNDFGDFLTDNDGNFIFSLTERRGNRENPSKLMLVKKTAREDTLSLKPISLNQAYLDEIQIKVDNVNKRYIINSFYYKEQSGNIEGIYNMIWDAAADTMYAAVYQEFGDDLRSLAK